MLLACLAFTFAQAQGVRAWQDLNFGDSPEVIHQKMEAMLADGRIARSFYHSEGAYGGSYWPGDVVGYPLSLAGLDMSVSFAFHDGGLYWLQFLGRYRAANFWDSAVMNEVSVLRDVLVSALGQPTEYYSVRRYDLAPYSSLYAYVWRGDDGVSRFLGVREGQYQYAPALVIQHDASAQQIRNEQEAERQHGVQDTAGGF